MKTVGILGGLGPLAGAHFYRRLVELTPAANDEEHIPIILVSSPKVPSRIAHLSGHGESPVPQLANLCRQLEQMGAEVIALPSTTTSFYQPEMAKTVQIPIISLIDVVTEEICRSKSSRVGIMGTTPTRTFGVYEQAFKRYGIEPVYPDDETQEELMSIIHTVKGAKQGGQPQSGYSVELAQSEQGHPSSGATTQMDLDVLSTQVAALALRPWAETIDAVLLGCTELPVLFPNATILGKFPSSLRVFSSTDILAAAVVRTAGSAVHTDV